MTDLELNNGLRKNCLSFTANRGYLDAKIRHVDTFIININFLC